jgi:hypothetical protein
MGRKDMNPSRAGLVTTKAIVSGSMSARRLKSLQWMRSRSASIPATTFKRVAEWHRIPGAHRTRRSAPDQHPASGYLADLLGEWGCV